MLKSNFNIKVSIEGYVDENGKRTKMDLTTRIDGDAGTNIFEEIKDVVSFLKKLDDEDKKENPRRCIKKEYAPDLATPETGMDLIRSLTPDQVRKLKKLLKRL